MTARNGKPCKKCGTSKWYKSGKCVSCKKEQDRIYRKAPHNIEKRKEYSRNNWWKYPKKQHEQTEDRKSYMRRYNKSKRVKLYQKEYSISSFGRSKKNAIEARRRTRKTNAGGSYTASEWNDLKAYHNNRCLKCGRDDVKLAADHIIPVANGGTSNIDNIQPLCKSCNSSKGTKCTDYRGGNFITRWLQGRLF